MRYVTIALYPPSGGIHPVGASISELPGVEREALRYVDAMFDGTGVLFYELSGPLDTLRERLDDHEDVIDYEVLDVTEAASYIYVYVKPGPPAGTLMYLAQKYALVVETPIEFREDGAVLITVAGRQESLREAFHEFPDDLVVHVECAGEYAPGDGQLLTTLTDRQREVLKTAFELGYYDVPRDATHESIARELDVATSTIDEHLRKAEARLFGTLLQRGV
ncbi:helix-turn-helix domain-containing protein [Halomarina rubra]|uniref:Helix-turn-helix domain-containing protein n=1 Tax=Halomarina rubra TaxID=2071873 RepID=A0ABD6AZI6_9EURY|nr:helix-turn-helix domain-containing protein [Halomarina rubra]